LAAAGPPAVPTGANSDRKRPETHARHSQPGIAVFRLVAVLIDTFTSVITLTGVMWFIQTGRVAFP
jgi:hypothetical protein